MNIIISIIWVSLLKPSLAVKFTIAVIVCASMTFSYKTSKNSAIIHEIFKENYSIKSPIICYSYMENLAIMHYKNKQKKSIKKKKKKKKNKKIKKKKKKNQNEICNSHLIDIVFVCSVCGCICGAGTCCTLVVEYCMVVGAGCSCAGSSWRCILLKVTKSGFPCGVVGDVGESCGDGEEGDRLILRYSNGDPFPLLPSGEVCKNIKNETYF